MPHPWLVYSSLSASCLLLSLLLLYLPLTLQLHFYVIKNYRTKYMPASVSPSVPSHSSQLKKDQTSKPIKKQEEKGKVMPEDRHGGQWHLNSVSLVWTISPLKHSCLSACRLTKAHTEFWRTWHTLEITVLLPLQTALGQGPRHTVTVALLLSSLPGAGDAWQTWSSHGDF